MRVVPESVRVAIQDVPTYKMAVKAIIDPSRSYFSVLTADFPYDAGDYSLVTETPVGQCACYSPTQDAMVTFIVNPSSGAIVAMVQGSATQHSLGLTAEVGTKPGVWDRGDGTAYLWYCNSSGLLTRVTVNMSSWGTSGSIQTEPTPEPDWSIAKGSPTPISETEVVYIYETTFGGLEVAYYDGVSWHRWQRRFLSPNKMTGDLTHWSIYSTAVLFNGDVYAYSTEMDNGYVRGVVYKPTEDIWADSFIALPADLSRFCITNARVANGWIHLAGQFHRTEDLVDAQVYSLVLRSPDGRVFSWDRFTLISKLGFQFNIDYSATNDLLYASDRNSVGTAPLSYFFVDTPTTRVTLEPPNDIISFNMSDTAASLTIKGHDEAYLNHAVIKKGSRCVIHLGYQTTVGMEYVEYTSFIIDKVRTGFASGVRNIMLDLVVEGIWKTDQIAFPFYSELISKSSIYDDCDERDLMYPAPGDIYRDETFAVDFWKHVGWDGGGLTTCTPFIYGQEETFWGLKTLGAQAIGLQTPDLVDIEDFSSYPRIVDTFVQVKLYGWARTDIAARANDVIALYMVTIDDEGTETEHTSTYSGSYTLFPRDYPTPTQPGDYPIIFQVSSLTEGHRIKRIMLKISNAYASGESFIYLERMEFINAVVAYSNISEGLPWLQTKPDSYADDDPTILEIPGKGMPHIMFLSKPYTAFNFSVWATFEYFEGAEPLSAGTLAWGVVGLAADAGNCFVARYSITASQLQLVQYRNGLETILATYGMGATIPYAIKFEHRDGEMSISYRNEATRTWLDPVIVEGYNETGYGAVSTSDTGIMHVGIYGLIQPLGFRTTSFGIGDCEGIAVMAGQGLTTITNFPSSGKVTLDDVIYEYTSKTPVAYLNGPYQWRNTWNYGGYGEDSTIFTGMGAEISHYKPANSVLLLQGYLFGSDIAHTWLIDDTDWTVEHSTGGVPVYLRNRCRHFGDKINDNHGNAQNKVWESPGLLGITRVADQDVDENLLHLVGTWVWLYTTQRVWVKEAMGTAVDHDSTVQDMTAFMCKAASVPSEYPGDWLATSLAISGTPVRLASTANLLPGGFDIHFTLPSLSSGQWIAIYASNMKIGATVNNEQLDIGFKNNGGTFQVFAQPQDSLYPEDYVDTSLDPSIAHEVRILFHEEFISVYVDDFWVHTFAYPEADLHWPQKALQIWIYASTSKTIPAVRVVELFDWREAIYVESEMSAQSALGSVIQERPIEIFPTVSGGLSFSYNLKKDIVDYTTPAITKRTFRQHERAIQNNRDAGSDAIVYFADVTFVNDLDFADSDGFLTRVLKLSSLDTGAKRAGQILLEKANERQYAHTLIIRPDARIEYGDIIDFVYILPGTLTEIAYQVIVEANSFQIAEGQSQMSLFGRENI
jgi:hypothetical protein